jgi:hypothetical protein
MGILAVCLVISFSAYQLTTYDAVRSTVGAVAAETIQGANLHTQYLSMLNQFNNDQGNIFTYTWGSQSINVTMADAQGQTEPYVIGLVLDRYSQNIYDGNVPNDLSMASSLAGSGANGFYFVTAILMFAAIFVILILSFIQQWYETTKDMLKSAGKIILIMSVLAFLAFLVLPPIVESVMYGSISGNNWSLNVNSVVEPRITSAFLVNSLILILFGALVYGMGFLFHINTGEEEVDAGEYFRSAPKKSVTKSAPKVKSDPGNQPENPGHRQL